MKKTKTNQKNLNRNDADTHEWLGQNLIFLISQPRSGSTLLQRIIAGHPDIHTTSESWLMLHPLYALKRRGIAAEYDCSLARQALDDFVSHMPEGINVYIKAIRLMGKTLYERTLGLSGKSIFLDKTPRYYYIIPELYRVFPKAKFILLLRNPMATLSSALKSWFNNDPQALKKSSNYFDVIKGPRLIVEGKKLLQADAIVLKYEDLVQRTEEVVEQLCNRIGLNFHKDMLLYGRRQAPEGRFGDTIGIVKHERAVSDYIEKWVSNLSSSTLIEFANKYLSDMGPDVISELGYSYHHIQLQLNSQVAKQSATINSNKIRTDQYLISAIVSTYNAERFIRGCLEDLEAQTIAEQLEIIIVNSGSTQNEEAIIKEFQEKHSNIKYIKTDKRETVYAAWNRAVNAARGKYITNANTDDRHRKDAFEAMANTLEKNPSISMVYADVIITETENETFEKYTPVGVYRWLDWNREDLLYKGCFMGPQPMWRRDIHDEYGYFDETFVTSGDYEFWLRISQTRSFLHIPEYLGLYLKSPASIEHSNRDRQKHENSKIHKMYHKAHMADEIVCRVTDGKNATPGDKTDFNGDDTAFRSATNTCMSIIIPTLNKQKKLKENREAIKAGSRQLQITEMIETADMHYHAGRLDQAVDTLLQGIGRFSDNPGVYICLAEILIGAGRYQDAKETLDEMPPAAGIRNRVTGAADSSPDYESTVRKLELLGSCEEGLKSYERAREHIDQALSLNPSSVPALNLKGILAFKQGDIERAEGLFQQAMNIDPGCGESCTNLGSVKWEWGEQEQAMQLFEKGFILSPVDPDVASAYHSAVTVLGEFETAEETVQQAAALYPQNKKIQYMLIDVLIQQGRYQQAMDEIESALTGFGIEEGALAAALKVREKIGPMRAGNAAGKSAAVSLCMIVKDEEEYLARCLASVKPVVDEMIVVDTGSTDRTRNIAIAFGARVFDIKWRNDFAVARNYSISKANGNWILVMDADEVISPIDYSKFNRLVKNVPNDSIGYSVVTRNYCNLANTIGWEPNVGEYPNEEKGSGWLPSTKVRLFFGRDRIRFEGAVHELVEPILKRNRIKIKNCRIPIHHYGRLNRQNLDRKGETYYRIGRKKLEESGEDAAALRELATQATILGKNKESIELWKKFLEMSPPPQAAAEAFVNLGSVYTRMGKHEKALAVSKLALQNGPDMKEPHYNHAMAQLHLGNVDKAITTLENLLNNYPDYPPAQFVMAAAYFCDDRKSNATERLIRLKNSGMRSALVYSFLEMAGGLVASRQVRYAQRLLEGAIENEIINKELLSLYAEILKINTDSSSVENSDSKLTEGYCPTVFSKQANA